MNNKILSLDLGITSIGYSILNNVDKDEYKLIDYGLSMFDKPIDNKGDSKKVLHSEVSSSSNLVKLRKIRKKKLASLFNNFKLGDKEYFLYTQKQNIYKNKWMLRAKKAFEEKLEIEELFSIFYTLAKHRGYKSLDSDGLLQELCDELSIHIKDNKSKKDDEKGKIKQSLRNIETLKANNPNKSVASIIYDEEMKNKTPIFRNHNNYKYMIRREYIEDEIKLIVNSQKKFGLFDNSFDIDGFIDGLKEIIIKQKESTNDLSLFSKCEFYPKEIVAHQYSLLSDIFKMYQSVFNITFNKNIKITKEQAKLIANDFFKKIKKGKNISSIKYKDIRKILKLNDDMKIFNKEDAQIIKGKKNERTIIKFHFLNTLSKIDNKFILSVFKSDNKYQKLKDIFDIIHIEKSPRKIYEELKDTIDNESIIELIKNKEGNSLRISSYAMVKIIPYFEKGFSFDDIKEKLKLQREENYSSFKKGIKYLNLNQYENDDDLKINNHPVKYVVSATLRLIKHLHSINGAFDEIRVESTRELSQNKETKKEIDEANRELEKKIDAITTNKEYQKIANTHNKNLKKYARKILMYEEQNKIDLYTGKGISFDDIFTNTIDIDHIIPQSLGGLFVKHNLVLAHRDSNTSKTNQLPINFVQDKQAYINRVEALFKEHKINWKKKINLLANNLDETFKDVFESKDLRATSYIEALTAKVLKRYYPFTNKNKQKNGIGVKHIQGRATSNIRKILKVKTKTRDTNIHHAIDAILIGLTSPSWLQKLSNTFRENMGIIDDKARDSIKKNMPTIEGAEAREIIGIIEDEYNKFGEDSVFYKDIFKKIKVVNFWVSKKPMSSKIHKDTIYAIKENNIYTYRVDINREFISLKVKPKLKSDKFIENFTKKILDKMYLQKINPNDKICQIIKQRAKDIATLLDTFINIDIKDKESISKAQNKIDTLIHSNMIDNNNIIRKIKFHQTNLTGYNIKKGLAVKEKSFIGFLAVLNNNIIEYKRIDMSNFGEIKRQNDNSFKVYKNDIVFFVYPDGSFYGGKIVSFLDDTKMGSFSNPRFPANVGFQPHSFITIFNEKPNSHKQKSLNQAIGIIKLHLDIIGNIKSYSIIGDAKSDILNFIKGAINGVEDSSSNKSCKNKSQK